MLQFNSNLAANVSINEGNCLALNPDKKPINHEEYPGNFSYPQNAGRVLRGNCQNKNLRGKPLVTDVLFLKNTVGILPDVS